MRVWDLGFRDLAEGLVFRIWDLTLGFGIWLSFLGLGFRDLA